MEVKNARIKSLYGEVRGILEHLPTPKGGPYVIDSETVTNYNALIDELEGLTDSNYSRQRIKEGSSRYSVHEVRPVIGGLVAKLEEEYGFGQREHVSSRPLTLVTVNQSQNQIQVTQVDIDSLIENEESQEEKELLRDIKNELTKKNRDSGRIRSLLGTLLDKSWELFIAILPYVLEQLGRR